MFLEKPPGKIISSYFSWGGIASHGQLQQKLEKQGWHEHKCLTVYVLDLYVIWERAHYRTRKKCKIRIGFATKRCTVLRFPGLM